jgi:hypothetical protein
MARAARIWPEVINEAEGKQSYQSQAMHNTAESMDQAVVLMVASDAREGRPST